MNSLDHSFCLLLVERDAEIDVHTEDYNQRMNNHDYVHVCVWARDVQL